MPEKIHCPHLHRHTCIPCQVLDIPITQLTSKRQDETIDGIQHLSPVALKPCPSSEEDYVFYTYKNVKLDGNWYLDPQK